ncbi:MAG: glyoxalase superfamily protein [Mesorhizobium sp.]
MRTYRDAKAMAKAMREALAEKNLRISHAEALEIIASQFGVDTWNVLSAKIEASGTVPAPAKGDIGFEQAVPIVRIFDIAKAHEFYLDFLGFKVDWEHRFGENFPLYEQISRQGLKLHLSEHAGDASPGCNMVVTTSGVAALQRELAGKNYRYMKPGVTSEDWGDEMQVTDPFGNRIRFIEDTSTT